MWMLSCRTRARACTSNTFFVFIQTVFTAYCIIHLNSHWFLVIRYNQKENQLEIIIWTFWLRLQLRAFFTCVWMYLIHVCACVRVLVYGWDECSVQKRTVMRYLCNDTCALYEAIVPSLHSPICGRSVYTVYTIALQIAVFFRCDVVVVVEVHHKVNGIGSFCCFAGASIQCLCAVCVYVCTVRTAMFSVESWTHAKAREVHAVSTINRIFFSFFILFVLVGCFFSVFALRARSLSLALCKQRNM